MDGDRFPRVRRVTGLFVGLGLLLGCAAGLVWYLAASGGVGAGGHDARPGMWPSLPLLSALGMGIGWFVAACANAEGWRLLRLPSAGMRPTVALTCGTALLAGVCFAWLWTLAPPPSASADALQAPGEVIAAAGPGTPFCGDAGTWCVFVDEPTQAYAGGGIGAPWLAFPLLGVTVAAVVTAVIVAAGLRLVRWSPPVI